MEYVSLKTCAAKPLGIDKTKTILICNTKADDLSSCCNRKYDVCVIVNKEEYKNNGVYNGTPLYIFKGENAINYFDMIGGSYSFTDMYTGKVDWQCRMAWLDCFSEEMKTKALEIEAKILADKKSNKSGLTSEYAWKVYNFINEYKSGSYGEVILQEAIDKYFDNYI